MDMQKNGAAPERVDFSKIRTSIPIPNLIEVQKKSYERFLQMDLLPNECEYVTIKNGSYPLIITAHPVSNFDEWFRKFERNVVPFAKQSLWDFVGSTYEFLPLEFEAKTGTARSKSRSQVAETAAR